MKTRITAGLLAFILFTIPLIISMGIENTLYFYALIFGLLAFCYLLQVIKVGSFNVFKSQE